ncbi:MAG: hypothetical protein ACXV7F_14470, partial [Methylomonas sp.]
QSNSRKTLYFYMISLVVGFLAFCFFLKWQPWNSRLSLPLLVLWSPEIGISISYVHRNWIAKLTMILLLLAALPLIFWNYSRPLLASKNVFNTNRTEQYFRNRPSLTSSYAEAASLISNEHCRQIGLYLDFDDWEYPFWAMLQQDLGKDVRIEAVNVENVSARKYKEFPEFTPCAVLAVNPLSLSDFEVNGTTYSILKTTEFVTILTPK